jgi:hypothetical protein
MGQDVGTRKLTCDTVGSCEFGDFAWRHYIFGREEMELWYVEIRFLKVWTLDPWPLLCDATITWQLYYFEDDSTDCISELIKLKKV